MKLHKLFFIFLTTATPVMLHAITKKSLMKSIKEIKNPFPYRLGLKIIPSKKEDAEIMICCHGYGHNNQIADVLHSYKVTDNHLVSFNFPDHDITNKTDHRTCAFGTINELLPLVYVLKQCVVDLQLKKINLYGFSAGGGAVINTLVVLNQPTYNSALKSIGVTQEDIKTIIAALQAGWVLLDCPLKSVEEAMEAHGPTPEFAALAEKFRTNNMRPIDSVARINGMQLNIIVHFQQPDEILGNKDDALFVERLQKANNGKTVSTFGSDGGHNSFHTSLWNAYKKR